MGEVYLAHDTVLERAVAIKFLRDDGGDRAVLAKRLRIEAQAAAALDHPNICAIYEVGTDAQGHSFIAMQYVDGETLASRLKGGPLSVDLALDLTHGIADALDAAHRRGVIHRDLKPQNIMLTPSGTPKLLDFGIARVVHHRADSAGDATTTRSAFMPFAGTPGTWLPRSFRARRPTHAATSSPSVSCSTSA